MFKSNKKRRKIDRNLPKSKYENINKESDPGKSFQGQHKKGFEMHNEFYEVIKESRIMKSSFKY